MRIIKTGFPEPKTLSSRPFFETLQKAGLIKFKLGQDLPEISEQLALYAINPLRYLRSNPGTNPINLQLNIFEFFLFYVCYVKTLEILLDKIRKDANFDPPNNAQHFQILVNAVNLSLKQTWSQIKFAETKHITLFGKVRTQPRDSNPLVINGFLLHGENLPLEKRITAKFVRLILDPASVFKESPSLPFDSLKGEKALYARALKKIIESLKIIVDHNVNLSIDKTVQMIHDIIKADVQ
jgi:hypothetical protein